MPRPMATLAMPPRARFSWNAISSFRIWQSGSSSGLDIGAPRILFLNVTPLMVIGLANSVGDLEKGMPTKGSTYKQVKEQVQKFKEKNGSYLCRELKGVETGKVLCSCPQCIMDAVALTEEYLKKHQADK